MSEHLPYEEMDKQFNDLPLPDQEASWQKMKELLDKEDDDDRILPPVLLRSCLGWGMLLLAGLVVAWLVVRPERWWKETAKTQKISSSGKIQKQTSKARPGDEKSSIINQPDERETNSIINQKQNKISATQSSVINSTQKNSSFNIILTRSKNADVETKATVPRKNDLFLSSTNVTDNKQTLTTGKDRTNQRDNVNYADTVSITNNQQQDPIIKEAEKKESLPQAIDSTIQKKTKYSQKKLVAAVGIGLQQQIPIAGQTAVPYSYYGRKGSIADYVPSIFLQLHKEKKWFIMGEFRFGATQFVKEFSFNRNTKYDTASMNLTVTTMRLKETYYHQLPLSFNYYIIPNLSVGVGGMYSRFYGATIEKETETWNALTQTSKNFKEIIPVKHFTDSFLYKTQVHVLLQADYQWKRFSFGLRYTKDVQPYIKYTKPDGTIDEEKNQSLQLIVRYRIWPGKL